MTSEGGGAHPPPRLPRKPSRVDQQPAMWRRPRLPPQETATCVPLNPRWMGWQASGPWDPGQRGGAPYLRRQAVADGVHVVGGGRRVHEAVGVAGEAVAGSVGRAGVRGCGRRGQAPLVHGGRRRRRSLVGCSPWGR